EYVIRGHDSYVHAEMMAIELNGPGLRRRWRPEDGQHVRRRPGWKASASAGASATVEAIAGLPEEVVGSHDRLDFVEAIRAQDAPDDLRSEALLFGSQIPKGDAGPA